MSSRNAIGVFDSGLGGLSAVKEFMHVLPNENIIYFGDTGRVPYGTRSRDTINKYAFQDAHFLLEHDVKMVVKRQNRRYRNFRDGQQPQLQNSSAKAQSQCRGF